MQIYQDALALIGNTPIMELQGFDTGPCRLFAKLEFMNPGGSIKDRIGLSMIEDMEQRGELKLGDTIVEATAGNTGLGLALVSLLKGYKLVLVLPDKMSQEKISTLRCMGVEIIMTRSDVEKGHPEYYQDMAQRISKERGGHFINQFANPANVRAHRETTGPEIWQQMDGKVDAFVCGVGSGGTLTGVGSYLKQQNPKVELVLADPEGSILAEYVESGEMPKAGSWLVEGIGEDFIPEICDISLVDTAYTIPDSVAFGGVREILSKTGIMVGTSSGVLVAAALRYCRQQTEPKNVVTLMPDSGTRYLTKVFNDDWMLDQGFVTREEYKDLRDVIAHRHSDNTTITVGPDDKLASALYRAKQHGISQLPVMESEKIVGIIDEWDMLVAIYEDPAAFDTPVAAIMTSDLEVIDYRAPINEVMNVFARGHVAIVMDGESFLGIITRIDLINHLRKESA